MTEYDYSPEGYQRYIDTQHRIAKWVDNTNAHAHEFRHPFGARSGSSSAGDTNRDGSSSRDVGSGHGSRSSTSGSAPTASRRRNSLSYESAEPRTKGLTTTAGDRKSYPYPVPRSQIPIPPTPALPPPKPSPATASRHTNTTAPTRTHTRSRSISQSYVSSPVTGSTTQRDSAYSSHQSHSQLSKGASASQSRSRSRSVQPSRTSHHTSTRGYVNPNTGNPPTRSGTYPIYSSKPSHSNSKSSSLHVKNHDTHDRSHSLSQVRPASRATNTPQYIENSGIMMPTSSSRRVYTSSKPMMVGGYTILPQNGKEVSVIY